MAVFNLGSINADHVYRVAHLPRPGETLAARALSTGLGGKGANMSVAAARAASHVRHLGAVGADGRWAVERLMEYGVDTRHIAVLDVATGHAVINVDDAGENAIVLFPGANQAIGADQIGAALVEAATGDTLLLQNETCNQRFAAETGSKLGLRVAYAAAPFEAQAVADVLPFTDLLVLNEVEAEQLCRASGLEIGELGVADVVVTLGARGCRWIGAGGVRDFAAEQVRAVDTTGAGDTFTGYLVAALDQGQPMAQAIGLAMRAAALMVTRAGTADVIPDLAEVRAFRP